MKPENPSKFSRGLRFGVRLSRVGRLRLRSQGQNLGAGFGAGTIVFLLSFRKITWKLLRKLDNLFEKEKTLKEIAFKNEKNYSVSTLRKALLNIFFAFWQENRTKWLANLTEPETEAGARIRHAEPEPTFQKRQTRTLSSSDVRREAGNQHMGSLFIEGIEDSCYPVVLANYAFECAIIQRVLHFFQQVTAWSQAYSM